MSDTKNLIKRIDGYIKDIQKERRKTHCSSLYKRNEEIELTEIKGIVELYEKSKEFTKMYLPIPRDPQLSDDLVEKIIEVVKNYTAITLYQHKDGSLDIYVISQVREEIRKPLQSQVKPKVMRGNIEKHGREKMFGFFVIRINHKSKDVEVV